MAKIISSLPGSTGVLSKTSQLINDGETGISTYVELNDLSTVATTGDYNNLINVPINFTPKVHTHNISDISGTKSEFNTSLTDGNFLFVGDVSNTPDATTVLKGKLKLSGDLGGTADLPTVPNKLDKGTYPGTAQDLKEDIDNIYVPDTVIRTTEPTRVGNVFTFPVDGYEVLLNKTRRSNTAAFVTTIDAATTDYKRVDLIYFKSDNTIAKLIGAESTTVAIRPDVPANAVGISFINVFGNTIETPTPIDKTISIQDSSGIEKFKIIDYLRFKGTSFNVAAKQIEIDPLVPLSAFLDITLGNDLTGTLENANKPFQTMAKLISSLPTTTGETYTIYIKGGNVSITRKMPGRNLKFVAFTPSNLDFTLCKENDGVTEASEVLFGYVSGGTWTFENNNISMICNFVGNKRFQIGANSPILKGGIDTFNWKSGDSFGAIRLVSGSDITINNLYDSPQSVPFLNNTAYTYNVKIKNFNVQYGRAVNNTSQMTIDNIIKVGTGTFTLIICSSRNSGSISVGNITLSGCTFQPQGAFLNLTGTISTTTEVSFNLATVISGNFKSTLYPKTSYLNYSQVFRNYTGKLNNVLIGESGDVTFENCIIETDTFLAERRMETVGVSTRKDVIKTVGFNVFSQVQTSYNLFYAKTGFDPDREIQVRDEGVIETNALSLGETVNYMKINNSFKEKSKEIVVRSKKDLVGRVLNSNTTYIIDGSLTLLTGEYIEVPAGGLTIVGYGFDVSQINKNVAGQSIFTSPAGNSGNFVTKDLQYNSGAGSVFNITDSDGSHAIEINDVNFQSCASLGTLTGYRQFTGTTCGIYGCSNGFQLSGNWRGFKFTNSNVISFLSGVLIKKDTDTLFSNRLYLDLNFAADTGAILSDFGGSNFASDELFQINNTLASLNGSKDATVNTPILLPNITPNDPKARFTNCLGITVSASKFQDLKSPDGNVWRLSVDNSGVITATDI